MELTQQQIDALMDASAKIEQAEAEKARLDLIGQKNDELDAKLAVIAESYRNALDEATLTLTALESVQEDERDQEAIASAVAARRAIIEDMANECAEAEAAHIQESAATYNA